MLLRVYLNAVTRQAKDDRKKCIEMWLKEVCKREAENGENRCTVYKDVVEGIRCNTERLVTLDELKEVAKRNKLNVIHHVDRLVISWGHTEDGDDAEEYDEEDWDGDDAKDGYDDSDVKKEEWIR